MSPTSNVATFISFHVDTCGKTAKEISEEVGFARPNIISMIKSGVTKVPIARIPALARAILVDPVTLFRMCMEEYMPDVLEVCDEVYGSEKLTTAEREVINILRTYSNNKVPAPKAKTNDLLQDWVRNTKK